MTNGKEGRPGRRHPWPMFDTAPILTPFAALLTGMGVILGGCALFAVTLWITRWLARR